MAASVYTAGTIDPRTALEARDVVATIAGARPVAFASASPAAGASTAPGFFGGRS